jgi:hypothetical protein
MKQAYLRNMLTSCCACLLAFCHLQPVTVPYYEWLPLGSDAMKQAYLRNMLGLPSVQQPGAQ